MAMSASQILGFRLNNTPFYFLGKKYRLSSAAIKSLKLFLDIVCAATTAQDAGWLIPHRETIRTLQRVSPPVGLMRVIAKSNYDEVVRLAIWIRGRSGSSFGSSVVAWHCKSDSPKIRHVTARCLQRMHAWQYLHTMLDDPEERVRSFAERLSLMPVRRTFEQRLESFTDRVQRRTVDRRPMELMMDPSVKFDGSKLPRPPEFFRRLLLRIRRHVLGQSGL